jgi:hypothetical protein
MSSATVSHTFLDTAFSSKMSPSAAHDVEITMEMTSESDRVVEQELDTKQTNRVFDLIVDGLKRRFKNNLENILLKPA